jgi:hypothetical protein
MLKGKAQWRNSGSKLDADVEILRLLQQKYNEKDELLIELAQSKRSLSDLRGRYKIDLTMMHTAFDKAMIQNSELRRQQGSGSKMADYDREEMVKMMEKGAVERGQLETEVESLKVRVRKLETEAELHENKVDNSPNAGEDEPTTKAFKALNLLNEFYTK